jgi:2,6-dihydroxypyridine 3-monooxygenase
LSKVWTKETIFMQHSKPRVLIMGGSLGGLTAALVLRKIGCEVDVFERSNALLEGRGAGIITHSITIRYPTEFADYSLDDLSVKPSWCRYIGAQGDVVSESRCNFRVSSYGALYRALLHCFGRERYHLGKSVSSFRQSGSEVTVSLSDDDVINADLLVCADGINSTARKLLVPTASAEYAGYFAWRGTVGAKSISKDTFSFFDDAITYFIMLNGHALTYPIVARDQTTGEMKRLINWLWYRNMPKGKELDDLLTDRRGVLRDTSLAYASLQEGHVAHMRQDSISALPPVLSELVVKTEEPFIQAIFDSVIPAMAFGRVCIMGDAAFVARPHAAAGTAKAAEDAWQLGEALTASDSEVVAALKRWEERQLACGQQLVSRARDIGNRFQFSHSWPVGEAFPFGLYESGDSAIVASDFNNLEVTEQGKTANSRPAGT